MSCALTSWRIRPFLRGEGAGRQEDALLASIVEQDLATLVTADMEKGKLFFISVDQNNRIDPGLASFKHRASDCGV